MLLFPSLSDLDIRGKKILLRCDLNVPMKEGKVTDATRIDRSLPTIRTLLQKGGKVILLSHFGRPKGKEAAFSLRPLVAPLSKAVGKEVHFASDCVGEIAQQEINRMQEGEILLLENVRFHAGEEKNDPVFARSLAALGDIYVNDAFSCAHRAHASTEGLAHLLPKAAGLAMEDELRHLSVVLDDPKRPVMAIIGGAKISTKLDLLGNLCAKVQSLAIGGGMANTFLAAIGQEIGTSLAERNMLEAAKEIMDTALAKGCKILLPIDGVIAPEFREGAQDRCIDLENMPKDQMILDIGPKSIAALKEMLHQSHSLVWNGPLGAFEIPPFNRGTDAIAEEAATLTRQGKLISVAGGGDTVAALGSFGKEFTYLSTAGGAFLEWLEGKELPGVVALQQ